MKKKLFMSNNISKNISNLSGIYIKTIIDHAKQYGTYVIETLWERVIQEIAEATGDLIHNKIANKITKSYELQQKIVQR